MNECKALPASRYAGGKQPGVATAGFMVMVLPPTPAPAPPPFTRE